MLFLIWRSDIPCPVGQVLVNTSIGKGGNGPVPLRYRSSVLIAGTAFRQSNGPFLLCDHFTKTAFGSDPDLAGVDAFFIGLKKLKVITFGQSSKAVCVDSERSVFR